MTGIKSIDDNGEIIERFHLNIIRVSDPDNQEATICPRITRIGTQNRTVILDSFSALSGS